MSLLSIIIPVKNGESTLEKCLSSISQQTIRNDIELIILDSESTDRSIEIAKRFRATIINIPAGTFNHGLTRNVGVYHSTSDFLYFTVQDAYLAENNQLEKMISHFSDKELQAVVGMQATPHDKDKNPARWFKRFTKPETHYRHFPDGSFGYLSLQDQFKHCSWDNVNAMYRKLALKQIPFVKTDYAEDWLWVKDALTAKMKIAFDPSLVVYHYHHKTFTYSFKVQYIVNFNFYNHFKVYPPTPSFIRQVATDIYVVFKKNNLDLKEKLYWSTYNFLSNLGVLVSHASFNVIGRFLGESALKRSFTFFCNTVPQGERKWKLKN